MCLVHLSKNTGQLMRRFVEINNDFFQHSSNAMKLRILTDKFRALRQAPFFSIKLYIAVILMVYLIALIGRVTQDKEAMLRQHQERMVLIDIQRKHRIDSIHVLEQQANKTKPKDTARRITHTFFPE